MKLKNYFHFSIFTYFVIQTSLILAMEPSQFETQKLSLPEIIRYSGSLRQFNKKDAELALLYQEAVKLLDAHVSPDIIKNGTPILIEATESKLEEIVSLLCQYKANVNLTDNTGDTALIKAARRNRRNIVRILLEYRANPNIKGQGGKTALMEAVRFYQMDDLLLAYGAEPDIQDDGGYTALMHFVEINYDIPRKDDSYMRIDFLDCFPNCSLKNNNGQTALDIARSTNNRGLIEQLSNVPTLEKLF